MTRRDDATARAAASWRELTATLSRLSDENFAALDPTSLDPVGVTIWIRTCSPSPSDQG